MPPLTTFTESLQELAPDGTRLLLAVSGGPDSMALLRLAHLAGRDIVVATVDHGLRPEAADEVGLVRTTAAALGLEFHTVAFDTAATARQRGWNLEDAARRLRYQQLSRIARAVGADRIVTAHTRDEQTETVLLQLLRGAAWLTGIPGRNGRVIRPLLRLGKQELIDWLTELGQEWCHDASNDDLGRERAWLRATVLPLLRERHPDLDRRVASLIAAQQRQHDFIAAEAARFRRDDKILAARLRNRHEAIRFEAVKELLAGAGAGHDSDRLGRIVSAMAAGAAWREALDGVRQIRLNDGLLELTRRTAAGAPAERSVQAASELPAGVSPAALRLPDLKYRGPRPGDRIRLAAGSRKLSDVFTDRKVPREQRPGIEVLASGSEVVWVDGLATAAGFCSPGGTSGDAAFMRAALDLATEAASAGEMPVGAVIVRDGAIIASARNETEALADPTAHAELLAVRRAAAALGDWRLEGCTLYVTLEPCTMCFGAMQQAHLDSVVYAAGNLREGATGGVADLDLLPWKRTMNVRRGPYARQAAELLSGFFRQRREKHP